jgi:hypothetical protein
LKSQLPWFNSSFLNNNYEMISLDLCCCEYDQVNKTGDSILKVRKSIERRKRIIVLLFQAIRRQLDSFGSTSFMDNKKIFFASELGLSIVKALKG